jgi:hypothetical protein
MDRRRRSGHVERGRPAGRAAERQVLTRIGLEFQSGNDVPFVQVRAQPLLESGKALRISRAVSPKGDRSVTVEVHGHGSQ